MHSYYMINKYTGIILPDTNLTVIVVPLPDQHTRSRGAVNVCLLYTPCFQHGYTISRGGGTCDDLGGRNKMGNLGLWIRS